MKKLLIAAACIGALAVSGCQSTKLSSFFGSSDPCVQAELIYAGFVTVAASTPKITAKQKKAAAAGIAAVREQCSDGNITKIELSKLVRAYTATINALK